MRPIFPGSWFSEQIAPATCKRPNVKRLQASWGMGGQRWETAGALEDPFDVNLT